MLNLFESRGTRYRLSDSMYLFEVFKVKHVKYFAMKSDLNQYELKNDKPMRTSANPDKYT